MSKKKVCWSCSKPKILCIKCAACAKCAGGKKHKHTVIDFLEGGVTENEF